MLASEKHWEKLTHRIREDFGKTPDINAILYLIGVQELGAGFKEFTKEQKQDLIHIATCKILSFSEYYKIEGVDEEGWPIWTNIKELPSLSLKEQENFLKFHILQYFSDIYNLE